MNDNMTSVLTGPWDAVNKPVVKSVVTSGATPAVIFRAMVPYGRALIVRATIKALRTDGGASEGVGWENYSSYMNNAGTITRIGTQDQYVHRTNVAYSVTNNVSGAEAVVTVTGVAGATVTWWGEFSAL